MVSFNKHAAAALSELLNQWFESEISALTRDQRCRFDAAREAGLSDYDALIAAKNHLPNHIDGLRIRTGRRVFPVTNTL